MLPFVLRSRTFNGATCTVLLMAAMRVQGTEPLVLECGDKGDL